MNGEQTRETDGRETERGTDTAEGVAEDAAVGWQRSGAVNDTERPAASEGVVAAPRFDEDGLPLDREATLDDVRSSAGSGRAIALGCSVLVVAAIALFWLVRGGLLD